MNFYQFEKQLSLIEENHKIFNPKFCDLPLWLIVKRALDVRIVRKITTGERDSFYRILMVRNFQILRFLYNSIISFLKWKFFLPIQKSSTKKIALLMLLGNRRYLYENKYYKEPFVEDVFISDQSDFDTFVIDSLKGQKREKQIIKKAHLRENFLSFPFSFFCPLSAQIKKEINTALNEIISIIATELKGQEDLLNIIVEQLKSRILYNKIKEFYVQYKIYQWFLKKLTPFIILLSSSEGYLGLIGAAKKMKIPVIEFQHGIIDEYHPVYRWPKYLKDYKANMLVADKLFLFGKYWSDQLLKSGFWSNNELIIIGNSKFSEKKEKITNKRLEYKKGEVIKILFTTAPYFKDISIDFLNEVIVLLITKNILFKLNIKLHPSEDAKKNYINLQQKFPQYCQVVSHQEKDIYDMFIENHVHLSLYSAAIFESFELGIPTIIFGPIGKELFKQLIKDGFFKHYDTPKGFTSFIINIFNDELNWKKFMNKTQENSEYFYSDYLFSKKLEYIKQYV